ILALSTLILFFFNHPATTEIYTLSLHDALPILRAGGVAVPVNPILKAEEVRTLVELAGASTLIADPVTFQRSVGARSKLKEIERSEEHTSELQSRENLVCRLLLEKKNKINNKNI